MAGKTSNIQNRSDNALCDITNLPLCPPWCLAARPDDVELNAITRVNNMLSNFVVTYFFKVLAEDEHGNVLNSNDDFKEEMDKTEIKKKI